MTTKVDVSIVGCGPIGLAGALLLAKFGIRSLIFERRSDVNTHPRSRFVDTNTMELMRLLGLEKAVEETGLGPDWTEYNRWFDSVANNEICAIPSPTFHTIPRDSSPTKPVMTCQDYVENVLLTEVHKSDLVDVWYRSEVIALTQDNDGTTATVKNLDTDEEMTVEAQFTLGTDGAKSFVRESIGSVLHTNPRPVHMQDVIFDADLSPYVRDRKGGLLYAATNQGVVIFQPLNGHRRWRCQIQLRDGVVLGEDDVIARIRLAMGAGDEVDIRLTSTGLWQPTPGCVDVMSKARVFLAGDAAHVTVPTGGMGNNVGFTGIRNLTWKLAYVLKGISPASILETYEEEHRPLTLDRIAIGVETTKFMGGIFRAFYSGGDPSEAIRLTHQYADYDGAILGWEIESSIIAKNASEPPKVENRVRDFVPSTRAGRRAPHVWLDEATDVSVLDTFGLDYVLLLGAGITDTAWQSAATDIASTGFPLKCESLTKSSGDTYAQDEAVLVRPDGIIAASWSASSSAEATPQECLAAMLPR